MPNESGGREMKLINVAVTVAMATDKDLIEAHKRLQSPSCYATSISVYRKKTNFIGIKFEKFYISLRLIRREFRKIEVVKFYRTYK